MQPDMNQLFQQMKQMQREVVRLQEELKNTQVQAKTGGGAVTVECTGAMEFQSIKISPDIVDPNDIGTLEDLILLAVNDAILQCQNLAQKGMGRSLGMGGPGMPPGIGGF